MRQKLTQFIDIIKRDKAVDTVVGFTGGARTNSGFVFIQLKSRSERGLSADQVIARLRRELAVVPGATLFLQSVQDIRVGGRQSNSQYQYTLQGDDIDDLRTWAPKIAQALEHVPELTDVSSDQQDKGLEIDLAIDRATASRLGLKMSQINNTLYDAFGQRQVSTIYNPLNQYHVIMEVAPRYWQSPDTLRDIYISTSGGAASGTQSTNALTGTVAARGGPATTAAQIASDVVRNQNTNRIANTGRGGASTGAAVSTTPATMIPLAAFAEFAPGSAPLAVNHQGQFLAATIAFNLAPGVSLSDATDAIERTMNELHVPVSIHGTFQGTAGAFQKSLNNQPILILAALIAVYVVLGILYESYIHPITILSTLPSAGVGAVLALMAVRTEFSIMALIGVILLIGIVKKNAIIMIDFAIDAERQRKLSPREAIAEACHLRFRPIMMTTMAALFGAVPLALGIGEGSEMRQPLGIAIVGGLMVSQMLTLYTTPVIYLYFDRLRLWAQGSWRRLYHRDRGAFLPGAGE
jgi:multidrug efflux pump